jgi:hypothetical protein
VVRYVISQLQLPAAADCLACLHLQHQHQLQQVYCNLSCHLDFFFPPQLATLLDVSLHRELWPTLPSDRRDGSRHLQHPPSSPKVHDHSDRAVRLAPELASCAQKTPLSCAALPSSQPRGLATIPIACRNGAIQRICPDGHAAHECVCLNLTFPAQYRNLLANPTAERDDDEADPEGACASSDQGSQAETH